MKKLRLSLLVLFAVAALHTAYGQAEVSIGIKGGLNFANIDRNSSLGENYNNRTGYHIGGFVLFKFANIGIQPELIYSQQGSTVKFNSQDFDSNFSYLNIPVILKIYLVAGLNLQAGPQFGFLMSADGPVVNGSTVTTGNIKDNYKSSDISIGLGAGWDLPFGLNVAARYNLGVTDNNNSASSNAAKNQVFQVSVGFKLIKFGS